MTVCISYLYCFKEPVNILMPRSAMTKNVLFCIKRAKKITFLVCLNNEVFHLISLESKGQLIMYKLQKLEQKHSLDLET